MERPRSADRSGPRPWPKRVLERLFGSGRRRQSRRSGAAKGQDVGVANGFWARLWAPRRVEPIANAECPICQGPVVVAPIGTSAFWGGMAAPRPREELVAACAVHGRPPYNQRTVECLVRH